MDDKQKSRGEGPDSVPLGEWRSLPEDEEPKKSARPVKAQRKTAHPTKAAGTVRKTARPEHLSSGRTSLSSGMDKDRASQKEARPSRVSANASAEEKAQKPGKTASGGRGSVTKKKTGATRAVRSRGPLFEGTRYQSDGAFRRKVQMTIAGLGCVLFICILGGVLGRDMKKEGSTVKEEAKAVASQGEEQGALGSAALLEEEEEEAAPVVSREPVTLTVSVIGDCTLGTDENFDWDSSLNNYYDMYGADYFLQNVKSIFEADDLTIANCEGALTYETAREDKLFAFRGEPAYAAILGNSGVDCANTANNHSYDYGEQGYLDTQAALDQYGVPNFGYDKTLMLDVKGVKVGLVGIYELDDHLGRQQQLRDLIKKVKNEGAELTIVIFHWGNELEEAPDSNQTTLGRLAIDLGADLVCGHHPHVLQGIEEYKGRNIVYSLGNFCFGGNTHPTEFDTMIFQQTFTIDGNGVAMDNVTNLIPCCVSESWDYNDYRPTPLSGEDGQAVLDKVAYRSSLI